MFPELTFSPKFKSILPQIISTKFMQMYGLHKLCANTIQKFVFRFAHNPDLNTFKIHGISSTNNKCQRNLATSSKFLKIALITNCETLTFAKSVTYFCLFFSILFTPLQKVNEQSRSKVARAQFEKSITYLDLWAVREMIKMNGLHFNLNFDRKLRVRKEFWNNNNAEKTRCQTVVNALPRFDWERWR